MVTWLVSTAPHCGHYYDAPLHLVARGMETTGRHVSHPARELPAMATRLVSTFDSKPDRYLWHHCTR